MGRGERRRDLLEFQGDAGGKEGEDVRVLRVESK